MGIEINRREFLSAWIFQRRSASVEIRAMEVFSSPEGPSAILVHHASEAGRDAFAEWLRANNGSRIVFRLNNGRAIDGRIFRVKMCFGRGLIVTNATVAVRSNEVLMIN
jgi:hypothetical protein